MKKKTGATPPTTMRIPADLLEKVRKRAERENRSVTNMTTILLERGLARSTNADAILKQMEHNNG